MVGQRGRVSPLQGRNSIRICHNGLTTRNITQAISQSEVTLERSCRLIIGAPFDACW